MSAQERVPLLGHGAVRAGSDPRASARATDRSSQPTTSSPASRKAMNPSSERTGASGRRSRWDVPPAASGSAALLPRFVAGAGERIV